MTPEIIALALLAAALAGFLGGYFLGRRSEEAYWIMGAENDIILGHMPMVTPVGTFFVLPEREYDSLRNAASRNRRPTVRDHVWLDEAGRRVGSISQEQQP